MKYNGILSSDARGSVAGTTASRNRYGTYFRGKAIPVNPRTPKQIQIRARLNDLSSQWKLLTDTQRAGWNSLAPQVPIQNSLGNTITLTGQQLYVGWNLTLLQNNIARNDTAPNSPPAIISLPVPLLAASAASPTFSVGVASGLSSPERLIVEATPPISPGRNFLPPSSWRYLTQMSATGTQFCLATYVAAFGTLVAGSKVYARVTPFNPTFGMKGSPTQANSVLLA